MFYIEIKGGCGTHPPGLLRARAFQGNLEGHCQYIWSTSWMCQPLSHPALGNKVPYVTKREPNTQPLSFQLNRKKKSTLDGLFSWLLISNSPESLDLTSTLQKFSDQRKEVSTTRKQQIDGK